MNEKSLPPIICDDVVNYCTYYFTAILLTHFLANL